MCACACMCVRVEAPPHSWGVSGAVVLDVSNEMQNDWQAANRGVANSSTSRRVDPLTKARGDVSAPPRATLGRWLERRRFVCGHNGLCAASAWQDKLRMRTLGRRSVLILTR